MSNSKGISFNRNDIIKEHGEVAADIIEDCVKRILELRGGIDYRAIIRQREVFNKKSGWPETWQSDYRID